MSSPVQVRPPIYDSHAHLISDDPVRYPFNPIPRDPNQPIPVPPGVGGRPGGMHGDPPLNIKPTAEQMHEWMAEEGVVGMAAVQKGRLYGTDNSYIVDAADLFPDEMRAIIIVDPQAPETPQMVRDFAKRGIIGIRFFGASVKDKANWLSTPAALEVWALAAELGVLVDVEAPVIGGQVLIPVIEAMADRFPNLRIVIDHVFMPTITDPDFGIGDQFRGLAARDNISVKFTSLNMDAIREQGVAPEKVLRRAVDFFGADKVMWGSDIGTSSGSYKEMIERAIDSTKLLTDEERRKVLHDTGRHILLGQQG